MNHTECRIAVLYRFYDNTDCEQIIDLIYCLILIDHLFINAEEMFDTPVDFCFDARILHMCRHFIYNLLYKFFPLSLSGIDLIHQIIEHFRL